MTALGDLGVTTVGALPQGLPDFRCRRCGVRDVDGVIPLAFACFLLAYIESVSAARDLGAEDTATTIDPRQELLGLGAANLAVAFGHGYPVAGGLSQSAVNEKAGAKTPLALVFASATIAFCLLFLTGLLRNLPKVVLAAIVLVAVKGLIDVRESAPAVAGEPARVPRRDGGAGRRAAAGDPAGRAAGRRGVAPAAASGAPRVRTWPSSAASPARGASPTSSATPTTRSFPAC